MRLKTIRIAGFKSFVDGTTFHLPSNLIGVVGPNGCGKSNIIDAVRWVMGESSARLLRGESMADVIFNGSSARKPVGTATVELLFDNSDGSAGGEYASYAEIAIKRQVSRDGQSLYYLNGTRCRRRDITDIFLGTGLGPRSYSIIEQGMISRIVEAKPEEIRTYLEEAAGISKYKERRRETENRIRHTRENLARLEDLRAEVDKHLEHLQRQAKQAERYKTLKAEYRQREAELATLRWQALDTALQERKGRLAERETLLEEALARLRAAEAEIEGSRERHTEASEHASNVQAELYEVGAEIARLEQAIAHRKDLQERQRRQQAEAEQQWQELSSHVDLDQSHLQALKDELARGEPELEAARETERSVAERYANAEEAVGAWQQEWNEFSSRQSESSRETEVERTRIEALDRSLHERSRRIEGLGAERTSLDTSELEDSLGKLVAERDAARDRQEALEQRLAEVRERGAAQADRNRTLASELNTLREQHQTVTGRLSSLEALQQAALGDDSASATRWLEEHGLARAPRLAQVIRVEAGFEAAAEAALGEFLDAVVVPDPWSLANVGDWPEGGIALVSSAGEGPAGDDGLAARVTGPAVLGELLAGVTAVDAPVAATGATLDPGQSIASGSGLRGGRAWLRVGGDQPTAGVLAREQEIKELRAERESVGERGQVSREALGAGEEALAAAETERESVQGELNMHLRRVAELEGQIQSRQARIDAVRARAARIDEEVTQLTGEVDSEQAAVRDARQRLQTSVDRMADLEGQRGALESRRVTIFGERDQCRAEARTTREAAQQLTVALETKRSALRSTAQALERTQGQIKQLEERRVALREQIRTTGEPLVEEEQRLEGMVEARLGVEGRLNEARAQVDALAEAIRQLDRKRHEIDAEIEQVRTAVSNERLESEGLRVKAQTLVEQLEQAGADRAAILETLPDDASADAWSEKLESLERRIRRLEPVNLAAIEEFEQEQERKTYLDAQNEDLVTALETLERAIRKIDRETRTRFKETFDRVNTGVQALFPRLFGGGHAFLELTSDDLLEAGVAIMARPPGKRISNIHLMSGGEKALTAVSFVFAIFQLNPAPFCMLDEVDAPLDDANVGRFSDMVRDMSEQVQFVVVTHNKITMAIAHQLLGVTMREPGVSRLVSVDIAEAERMAAS
ncbi:MAG: chromosome segregation protein SMC [Pseudomonadota bacterium]